MERVPCVVYDSVYVTAVVLKSNPWIPFEQSVFSLKSTHPTNPQEADGKAC